MASRLQAKLEQLEQQAAPTLALIREREQWVEEIRADVRSDEGVAGVNKDLEINKYLGHAISREQMESDVLEYLTLAYLEYSVRFGHLDYADENWTLAGSYAQIRLTREYYGTNPTLAETKENSKWTARLWADYDAGLPVEESEAAQRYIAFYAAHPRIRYHSEAFLRFMAGGDFEPLDEQP